MTTIRIAVACAGPEGRLEREFTLVEPATVADALAAASRDAVLAAAAGQAAAIGVWGKVKPLTQVLRDGDRVEMYRPLRADPKDARRARAGGKPRK